MNLQDLEKYNYELPEKLIRKVPLDVRHNAKLLVYNTKTDTVTHDIFINLYKYLPENSTLILNNTEVKACRLFASTQHGGKVEVFLLLNEWSGEYDVPVMINKSLEEDQQKILFLGEEKIVIKIYKKDNKYYLKNKDININKIIEQYGNVPIPHYLEDKENKLENNFLKERYNTVFADAGSSVAAPTASLHFTEEVFENLESKNIHKAFVTLDVGRGTFANLKEENFENNSLHIERYYIPLETKNILENKKENKINVVAVGTTACRAIESFAKTKSEIGNTDIFITPPYDFAYTDILVTNFHLPKTSLMLLVESFLQNKNSKKSILDLYKIAIKNEYNFYSFGDSMVIL